MWKIERRIVKKIHEIFVVNKTAYANRKQKEHAAGTATTNRCVRHPTRARIITCICEGGKNDNVELANRNLSNDLTKIRLGDEVAKNIRHGRWETNIQIATALIAEALRRKRRIVRSTTKCRNRKNFINVPRHECRPAGCCNSRFVVAIASQSN